jgi:capsule polysaccharide export protein KpsE/RkpR
MTEEKNGFYYMKTLWQYRVFIILFVIISTAVSAVVAYGYLKNEYLATASLVPPANSPSEVGGATSALSGALKDIGISKLSGSSGEDYSFIVLLESRTVKDSIIRKYKLWEEYDIPKEKMIDLREAFDAHKEIYYEKDGNFIIKIWSQDRQKAVDIANEIGLIANGLAMRIFREEADYNLGYMESRIKSIDSALIAISAELSVYSSNKLMFSPQEQAKAVSTSLAEFKSEIIQSEIMYNMYRKQYGENDPNTIKYKFLIDEGNRKVKEIENNPGFAGNFAVKNASEVGLKYTRLATEFETYSKVKAILLPTLEKYRIDLTRNLKSLFVVDKAIASEKKDRPRRSVLLLSTFGGSLSFAILIVIILDAISSFKRKLKQESSAISN